MIRNGIGYPPRNLVQVDRPLEQTWPENPRADAADADSKRAGLLDRGSGGLNDLLDNDGLNDRVSFFGDDDRVSLFRNDDRLNNHRFAAASDRGNRDDCSYDD